MNLRFCFLLFLVSFAAISHASTDFNPREFGAKADGVSNDAPAIQKAIDSASLRGGGTVRLDYGVWLSGTIYLKDNVSLEIRSGATLLGSTDKSHYNADDFCPQNPIIKDEAVSGAHLIVAVEVKNVSIFGGGTIDGNGLAFWLSLPSNKNVKYPQRFKFPKWRPAQMLFFCESQNVRISGVSLVNPPFWSLFLYGCTDVFVSDILARNDPRGHNNDGIDIDSCRNVVVSNCTIDTEDDCITLRSSGNRLLKKDNVCENIAVSNCLLRTRDCNAFRIGVGNGAIRDCLFSNISISGTRTGFCFLNSYKRKGGVSIERLKFSNILVQAENPLAMYTDNLSWGRGAGASYIRDISFDSCSFYGRRTNVIGADTNINIDNISFSDCDFITDGGENISDTEDFLRLTEWGGVKSIPYAFLIANARGVVFDNCRARWGTNAKNWLGFFRVANCFGCKIPSVGALNK